MSRHTREGGRGRGGGGGSGSGFPRIPTPHTTPFFPSNPYFFQNPNNIFQPLGLGAYSSPLPPFSPFQIPTAALPNPSSFQSPAFPHPSPRPDPREAIGRIEEAVAKAHQELLTAGDQVTSWKVSQAVLVSLKADSWGSLGIQMQDVPYLRRLMSMEGKMDAFIHCFVGSRKITSLHDLDVAICEAEGIERFEELGLGPLLRHPLVMHYFLVPADASKVPKVTTEEIIACLHAFVKARNNRITPEEFLGFLRQQYSIGPEEMIGVRIRNLGFYITRIRQAEKAELSTVHTALSSSGYDPNTKPQEANGSSGYDPNIKPQEVKFPPPIIQEKVELDRRFGLISGRMDLFSNDLKNHSTHIRFDSLSDGDDYDGRNEISLAIENQNSSKGKDATPRVSSCPYPSTAEEMARLQLNSDVSKKRSSVNEQMKTSDCILVGGKKRKINEPEDTADSYLLTKFIKSIKGQINDFKLPLHLRSSFELGDAELKDFLTTWKCQCQQNSVVEVLNTMLNFYWKLKRRKISVFRAMLEIFSSYPVVGLLNIFVASVKYGLIDTLYDTIESTGQNVGGNFETLGGGPAARGHSIDKKNVTSGDIIQKLSIYVPKESHLDLGDKPLERSLCLLKVFRDCESWLAVQFSVQDFSNLGHGDFCEFISKNIALLPHEMFNYLKGGISRKSSVTVSICQNQLEVFLSQAKHFEKERCTNHVLALFRKQFPTVDFYVEESIPDRSLSDSDRLGGSEAKSNYIFFSAALSCEWPIKDSLHHHDRLSSEVVATKDVYTHHSSSEDAFFKTKSTEDAIRCLLKTPMLSDLLSWSHWDILYAPSFGPLLPWLLDSANQMNLSCIVTSDGKFIRIDPSVTTDDFLNAAMHSSAFCTALKLLSLISVYGGISSAPKSLLKQLAQRAMEIMTKNFDYMDSGTHDVMNLRKPINQQVRKCSNHSSLSLEGIGSGGDQDLGMPQGVKKPFSTASTFVLDCLTYLPSEFRKFAAEIIVSGFRACTKEAYKFILLECKNAMHRTMLHDIGLALGIVEWIEDYNIFSLDPGCDGMIYSTTVNNLDSSYKLTAKRQVMSSEKFESYYSRIATNFATDTLTLESGQKKPEYLCKDAGAVSNTVDVGNQGITGNSDLDAHYLIESIRRDEFGLVTDLKNHESILLQKQHARLGRALHCLSQELYSQDSHLLLELIQNADDNSYMEDTFPTLIFILLEDGIVVLNNERGFTAQNIRALCDVGNSTKRASSPGYIGNKGIGFKSVFRVTDAPEIHSNGFHVKFDISEGQIGFVLPTNISPLDINVYVKNVSLETEQEKSVWNTCIVLPFRPTVKKGTGMSSIVTLFSDLHPSLLLFLHRLKCIQLRNTLNDTYVIMKKEVLRDGIIRVSHGNSTTSWLVVRKTLEGSLIRADVQTTEIAIAFTLQESKNGLYTAHLIQQPVFAFLPLRQYGLKFIIQGDFVLPSSREEVDGDSAWNQWLLSEIPSLFVSAERSFCELPCFEGSLGKAVSTFMSFVPLAGEVYGFFSSLPNMILSKLRMSSCLLLEGYDLEWFPPCRALRGGDDQAKSLLPDSLLQQHLGLGYLRRDISLSDGLARALGVKTYTPKILVDVISSICQIDGCLKLLGLDWLASFLVVLNNVFLTYSVENFSSSRPESDLIYSLKEIPIIPLSDGTYCSIAKGPVWLSSESLGLDKNHSLKEFPCLYRRIRTVEPLLFSAEMTYVCCLEERRVESIRNMLHRIGVQQLSAHEIIRMHIINDLNFQDYDLMIEYLSFVMLHFQYSCTSCLIEKDILISELQSKSIISTNHGFKCPMHEPIHFGKAFGNPININKLVDHEDAIWHEVDMIYLNHFNTSSLTSPLKKWRDFFINLGVTDFVQVTSVEKDVPELMIGVPGNATNIFPTIRDWECSELLHLLSNICMEKNLEKSKHLLEALDRLWDENYSARTTGVITYKHSGEKKVVKSSFMNNICSLRWVSSKIDMELHCPNDLYHDCDDVRSILGPFAPYAVPKVNSNILLNDIGFKTQVTIEDAVYILEIWSSSDSVSMFSIVQMSRFYHFICDGISTSKEISNQLRSKPWIFVPFIGNQNTKELVQGSFLVSDKVYWHDPTGCVDQIREKELKNPIMLCKMLDRVYPGLHDFFVNACGVHERPCFGDYIELLLQLASVSTPKQASHFVMKIFLRWADDIKIGSVKSEDVAQLKEFLAKIENKVLPTVGDKWVSLHPSCGIICWSDDEELRLQFKHSRDIEFLHFGDLNEKENIPHSEVALLMQRLGIPVLSEIVNREAIFYGIEDNEQSISLIKWILPFAQRYVLKLHSDRYKWLEKSLPERFSQLQIYVVESLFYKYTLKGKACSSTKRFECSCLLQGNKFFIRQNSDSHCIFLEFSRAFFDGTADLQMANFLHMIATMKQSGSSGEQIDFFVADRQRIPMLPFDEPVWTLSTPSASPKENYSSLSAAPLCYMETVQRNYGKSTLISHWPPTDWKNAPGSGPQLMHHFTVGPDMASQSCSEPSDVVLVEDICVDVQICGDENTKDGTQSFPDTETISDQLHAAKSNLASIHRDSDLETTTMRCEGLVATVGMGMCSVSDTLSVHSTSEEDAFRIGRLGEAAAYRYFSEKLGSSTVKWVNRELETGLPYDLLIGKDEDTEYIEVKSTKSRRKNWFDISTREWQFAAEKGESFSIARVVLVPPNTAQVTVLRNPVKLCQRNLLHLAVLMPNYKDS